MPTRAGGLPPVHSRRRHLPDKVHDRQGQAAPEGGNSTTSGPSSWSPYEREIPTTFAEQTGHQATLKRAPDLETSGRVPSTRQDLHGTRQRSIHAESNAGSGPRTGSTRDPRISVVHRDSQG